MTNKEFAEKLHEAYPKLSVYAAREVMNIIGDIAAAELLSGGEVPIPHVGKLKVRTMNPRTGRNPRTCEPNANPQKRVVRYSALAPFNNAMN